MDTNVDIKTKLTDFICEVLLDGEDDLASDENLLADGMIDSLGMLRLVAHIEDWLGVKVPPEHFTIDNFRSVDAIEVYLRAAQGGAGANGD